jgi:hypothetical protein
MNIYLLLALLALIAYPLEYSLWQIAYRRYSKWHEHRQLVEQYSQILDERWSPHLPEALGPEEEPQSSIPLAQQLFPLTPMSMNIYNQTQKKRIGKVHLVSASKPRTSILSTGEIPAFSLKKVQEIGNETEELLRRVTGKL